MQLNNPPKGVYFPGMTVKGTIQVVNDEPANIKAIDIEVVGQAHVQWTESKRNCPTENYISHESYLNGGTRVWDKETSAGGEQFPVCNRQFPFSIQLGNNLPTTYEDSVGYIKYTIEASVVRDDFKKSDTVCTTNIKVIDAVKINRPDLLQPKSMEVQKTLDSFCCTSGPIVITARIPRTGYCIQLDSIPVEVSVENGSSREIQKIIASIHKLVTYTAQGQDRCDIHEVTSVGSQPVRPHDTVIWQPPPIAIPDSPATSTYCSILQINYILRVKAAVTWAINASKVIPTIDIPLVLGNVPLEPGQQPGGPLLQQELEPLPPEASTPYYQQPQLPMSIPSTPPPPYSQN